MAEVQNDSTRVFVKGLPPSFTTDQLASHFGKQFKVTDAHVISERRIGFVGFNDHDSAQGAVNHFNRSFIRMSKISVDLAKPVEFKRDASGQSVPVSKRSSQSTTSRTAGGHPAYELRNSEASNKRKRDKNDDGEAQRALKSGGETLEPSQPLVEAEHVDIPEERPRMEEEKESEKSPVRSDNDWLRGKTSRLLDLVEPEDTKARVAPQNGEMESHMEIDTPEQTPAKGDNTDVEDATDQTSPSVPNGRLFIRNLAFDVTDADLQDRFGQFGKLKEVSFHPILF